MKPSQNAIKIVKEFEGLFLEAYQDAVNVWTIGWGTIQYPSGKRVKKGDTCTQAQAEEYLMHELNTKALEIEHHFYNHPINQNQFDALLSFTYNLGVGALKQSTLLKKVKANPNDPDIRNQFMRWVNAGGKKLNGLIRRRKAEADLYFS